MDLARKAVELTLAGDAAALRLCLDRIVAPRREQPLSVDLPKIRSAADIAGAMAALIGAAARGEIAAGQALALSQTVEIYVRAIEATEFEQRLRKLEQEDAAVESERYRY